MMNICVEKIRVLMAEREGTVVGLAADCGITKAALYALLKSGRTKEQTAGRLAHALGVTVPDILPTKEG